MSAHAAVMQGVREIVESVVGALTGEFAELRAKVEELEGRVTALEGSRPSTTARAGTAKTTAAAKSATTS